MKYIQAPVTTILFYLLPQKKHNTDTARKNFLIEIYTGGPSHKPYFIVLTLKVELVIRPTKKLVTSYMVGDLALSD